MSQSQYNYRSIWKISYPMMISGIGQSIINIMDTIFMGRIGEVEIGATAIGGLYYFTMCMVAMGFGTGLQIIVARLDGENKKHEIGGIIDLGLKFILSIAAIFFILNRFLLPVILPLFISSPQVLKATLTFLSYREFGYFFLFTFIVLRSFFLGMANTRVIAYATVLMASTNFILNYVLVFGYGGLTKMGIAGTALASTISEALACLGILIYTFKSIDLKSFGLFQFIKTDRKTLKETLLLSAPIMFQFFLAMVSWFIFFIIVEKMGERPLAISNLVRNVYMIIMIPLIAFTSVTSTIVSNLIGQGNNDDVFPALKKVIILSFTFTTAANIVFILIDPVVTLSIFTGNIELVNATIPTLWIITGSSLMFSVANILLGAVSGTGATRASLYIETTTLIFYLSASYLSAVILKLPIEQVWCTEYIYFGIIGMLSYWFLRRKKWSKNLINS